MRFHSFWQVFALRSPITKATIWRVRRQSTIQIQRLFLRKRTNDHNSSSSSTSSSCAGKSVSFKFGCDLTFFEANLQGYFEKSHKAWKYLAYSVFLDKLQEYALSGLLYNCFSDWEHRIYDSLYKSIAGSRSGSCHFSSSCCYRNGDRRRFSLQLS